MPVRRSITAAFFGVAACMAVSALADAVDASILNPFGFYNLATGDDWLGLDGYPPAPQISADERQRFAEIAKHMRKTIATAQSKPQDVQAAMQGVSFSDFAPSDTQYLQECRDNILKNVFEDATADETSNLVQCMHVRAEKHDAKVTIAAISALTVLCAGFGFHSIRKM